MIVVLVSCIAASLVPRPFPPPVFDCLQYANTKGEGLGDLVTCSDIRYTEGRHTGCGAWWPRALARLHQHSLSFMTPGMEMGTIMIHHCLPCVYLLSIYLTQLHVTKCPPSIFTYCKRSNTEGENSLEMTLHNCSTRSSKGLLGVQLVELNLKQPNLGWSGPGHCRV